VGTSAERELRRLRAIASGLLLGMATLAVFRQDAFDFAACMVALLWVHLPSPWRKL